MKMSQSLIKEIAREITNTHQGKIEALAEIIRDEDEKSQWDAFVYCWEEVLAAALEDAIGLEERKINSD